MRFFACLLCFTLLPFFIFSCSLFPPQPEKILQQTWQYYKHTFIKNGRVIRPHNNNDTVSEGQAYTMLRAVLMNDQETFDKCLAWSETVLSRKNSHGDYLLAWNYQNGKVTDTTAASDADIDYAYSLILAHRLWQEKRYLVLANNVLESILAEETIRVNRKLYLLPWQKSKNKADDAIAQNFSYYSPSHFKLFYEVTGDKRWLELTDTIYELLQQFFQSPKTLQNKCIAPDWIAIDEHGNLTPLSGKAIVFSWDAIRIPLRISADYYLYGDERARQVLQHFAQAFEPEASKKEPLFWFQRVTKPSDNAIFYSAMYAALSVAKSPQAPIMLQRARNCISRSQYGLFYNAPDDYYVNSLSWLPEYYEKSKTEQ